MGMCLATCCGPPAAIVGSVVGALGTGCADSRCPCPQALPSLAQHAPARGGCRSWWWWPLTLAAAALLSAVTGLRYAADARLCAELASRDPGELFWP